MAKRKSYCYNFKAVVVITCILITTGCKTSSPGSTAKSADSTSSGLKSRTAPLADLRYVMTPGNPSLPDAKDLSGIVYLRGAPNPNKIGITTGSLAFTLAPAVQPDDAKNTLDLALNDLSGFAYSPLYNPPGPNHVDSPTHDAYRLTFLGDSVAVLLSGYWIKGQFMMNHRQGFGGSLFMAKDPNDPLHWTRCTIGDPSYEAFVIIDKNGKETGHYQKYVDDMATASNVKEFTVFYDPNGDQRLSQDPLPTGPARDASPPKPIGAPQWTSDCNFDDISAKYDKAQQ